MKLNKRAFGLSFGILWGLSVFIATMLVIMRGGGDTMILLRRFYWGYDINFGGAVLGLIYGFVHGFIFGWLLGWLYNLAGKEKKEEKVG